MKFHRLFPPTVIAALAAILVGSAAVQAAPASGLLQGGPSVRALEAPATQPGIEKAYYYRRYYHRRYYHPYYHHYYHHYYRHYYHPYYRPYYHHYYHRYYHPYYHRRYYHRFYY
jgi:hypothetical protein